MSRVRWLGWMLARLVAVAVALLGAWIFVINLVEQGYDEIRILAWVLFSGLAGAVGGAVYLLTIDGSPRFQNRSWRLWGWGGMMTSALLPHSFTPLVLPAVLALLPTVFFSGRDREETVTSG